MATTLEIAKSLLSPPGDTIQEHIDFIGMSQVELSERMGRPKEKINDIIKGREPITTATALLTSKERHVPSHRTYGSRWQAHRQAHSRP